MFIRDSLVFKLFIAIAIITFASTNMRSKTETKDGSGSWTEGYTCPKIFFNEQGQKEVDNGEAVLKAEQMDKGTTSEDKLGLVLTFKNDIKTDLKNNVVIVSGKKVYIPWRNFNIVNAPEYTNPWGDNKYITATVDGDDEKKYTLKINLPYKTFGYYINDDEGTKIALRINNNANSLRNKVSSSKTAIIKSTNDLITANNSLEQLKKNKAEAITSTEAKIVTYETEKKNLEKRSKENDIKLVTAGKAFEIEQKNHRDVKAKLYAINSQIHITKNVLEGLKAPGEGDNVKSLNSLKSTASGDLDSKIKTLKTQAANRVTVVDTTATAAKAFKIDEVQSTLKQIVPTNN
jgi:hypothetical protein